MKKTSSKPKTAVKKRASGGRSAPPCSAWVDDSDAKKIIEATLATGPKTEEEIVTVLMWADSVRCGATMLEMVLEGSLRITLSPSGEVAFTSSPNETSAGTAPEGEAGQHSRP